MTATQNLPTPVPVRQSNAADPDQVQLLRPRSRKRTGDAAGFGQSPESLGDEDDKESSRIGVKRACNECRQQKLRCDVIQDPFEPCSRCRRCNLDCKIDTGFKRVGKRVKNAEMERELVELRRQLASVTSSPSSHQVPYMNETKPSPTVSAPLHLPSAMDQYMGSEEAVASLLDLRSGQDGGSFLRSPNGQVRPSRRLENVLLPDEQINNLYHHFVFFYHPFIPLLDRDRTPSQLFDASPLLFWTIMAVAARRYPPERTLLQSLAGPLSHLLWATLAEVPQSYHVVKALCILCTWPLPISSTSSDPTFMLSGIMMSIAQQIGLHRPTHAQDFTKFKIELRAEELKDRVKTWAACNVVAQRVATGYGQLPARIYDWTLAPSNAKEEQFRLPDDLEARLSIERFCNKVTEGLYSNLSDPIGTVDDAQRSILIMFLAKEFEELQQVLKPSLSLGNSSLGPLPTSYSMTKEDADIKAINLLYLRAAGLHFRLSAFFDSPSTKDYHQHLLALWLSTTAFLECAYHLENSVGNNIAYASNYFLQLIIAAGFALLKLLNSFFANLIDLEYGKSLFTRTISMIRNISVMPNDLPWRLAEVLAQLWRGGGSGSKFTSTPQVLTAESSLQLKVRCRMSMSLVFDSVWRWREEFQAKGRGNLESALRNPTNPDSAAESSASSVADHNLMPLAPLLGAPSGSGTGTVAPGPDNTFGEQNYEVFDPLNWMLDGLVDFPYSLGHGLDAQGLM